MDLKNVNSKTSNKEKVPKKKDKKDKEPKIYRDITYEYELNEEVFINEEGKKQITNLKLPYYRVTKVYLRNLNDMRVWMMHLNTEDDKAVVNPYLAHHFTAKALENERT